jgi:hypothetical protein
MKVWRGTMATALRALANAVEAAETGERYPSATEFRERFGGFHMEDSTAAAIEQVVRLVYALCDLDFWS